MNWLIALGVVPAIYGLHRLALWMESKGWIYYLHKKASPDALGNAVLGVQRILQPGTGHVLEVRQRKKVQQDDAGGPDKPGGAPASAPPVE